MPSSAEDADRAYHHELGAMQDEETGDVFVRADGDLQALTLSRSEALQLAGQLIRVVDGGFEQDVDDGEIRFADMALRLWSMPGGVSNPCAPLDHDEWVDPGVWNWYSNEGDAVLEFEYRARDGFEIGDGGVQE